MQAGISRGGLREQQTATDRFPHVPGQMPAATMRSIDDDVRAQAKFRFERSLTSCAACETKRTRLRIDARWRSFALAYRLYEWEKAIVADTATMAAKLVEIADAGRRRHI